MRVDFYDSNFNKLDISSLGLMSTGFLIQSPTPQHKRETVDYKNGQRTVGTTLDGRKMTVKFLLTAYDLYDYVLVQDEIFDYFSGLDWLYIVDKRNPGKRWRVKVDNEYNIDRVALVTGQFEVPFFSDSPHCESIGTTLDPLTFDADVWQFGQGLLSEDNLNYSHTADSFQIYNAGAPLDPREHEMRIEVITNITSSNNQTLSVINLTNGTGWYYTGPTTAGQIIELKGVQTLKGGASVSHLTNYGLIELNRGYNEFLKSSNIGTVNFDFRFRYL